MPAPHFSIWDSLALGLDRFALGKGELESTHARHAWPRYKRLRAYPSLKLWALACLFAFATLALAFSESPGVASDPFIVILRGITVGCVGVMILQVLEGYYDRSQQIYRRRRREALIHVRPRRNFTKLTEDRTSDPLILAELISLRRDAWTSRINGFHFWDWYSFANVNTWWAAAVPIIGFLPQAIPDGTIFGRSTRFFETLFILCVLAFAVASWVGRSRLRRLSLSMIHRVCPDCSYSLEDAPDATLPHAGVVLGLGPRHCTECGAPWPLLPPPKPAD